MATITCPSWCTVEHTRGDQFHRSTDVVAESFGQTMSANLIQLVGENCEVSVVVAGSVAMTPDKARQFGEELAALASISQSRSRED